MHATSRLECLPPWYILCSCVERMTDVCVQVLTCLQSCTDEFDFICTADPGLDLKAAGLTFSSYADNTCQHQTRRLQIPQLQKVRRPSSESGKDASLDPAELQYVLDTVGAFSQGVPHALVCFELLRNGPDLPVTSATDCSSVLQVHMCPYLPSCNTLRLPTCIQANSTFRSLSLLWGFCFLLMWQVSKNVSMEMQVRHL